MVEWAETIKGILIIVVVALACWGLFEIYIGITKLVVPSELVNGVLALTVAIALGGLIYKQLK